MKIKIILIIAMFFAAMTGHAESGKLSDAWGELIKKYPPPVPTQQERDSLAWAYAKLAEKQPEDAFRRDEIPEAVEEPPPEKPAHIPPEKVSAYHERLKKFQKMIRKASINFDVPEAIIQGVIMVESSGNPKAQAATSSAKGLMQTIDATFNFAKEHLAKLGITINDPFVPEDAITAGTWYLSYVFELARQDYPEYNDRKKLEMWTKALEYYYAGPGWGKDPNPVVHATIGTKKIVINKAWYARKVLDYAYAL